MEQTSVHRCFGGVLGYYTHRADTTGCPMRFTVFVPSQALEEKRPAVFFLSGLTCTEENFTVKAGAYRTAAELGLVVVTPDTSPRGDGVPDAREEDIGQGAGFYVDATQAPWSTHYRMESYITQELYPLVCRRFPVDDERIGIMGHSMGGHGALTLWLRHRDLFRSVSALAPICAPTQCPLGEKAFTHYLGGDRGRWVEHDATELMKRQEDAGGNPRILIDQGTADPFLADQLHPLFFAEACRVVGQRLKLRMQEGYDHSYFFVQSFIADHLRHHIEILSATGR